MTAVLWRQGSDAVKRDRFNAQSTVTAVLGQQGSDAVKHDQSFLQATTTDQSVINACKRGDRMRHPLLLSTQCAWGDMKLSEIP